MSLEPEWVEYSGLHDVTRVEVIDSTGRAFSAHYPPGVVLHVQDDGQTLKVFAGKPQGTIKRSQNKSGR